MPDITDQTAIQVRFTVREGDLEYTDALYYAPDEFANLSEADLNAAKLTRFNAWKALVTAPPAPPAEPSAEEKAAQLQALIEQQAALAAQIAALGGEG